VFGFEYHWLEISLLGVYADNKLNVMNLYVISYVSTVQYWLHSLTDGVLFREVLCK